MHTDDIYLVEWEDKNLSWLTEQFNTLSEATTFMQQLIDDGEAYEHSVQIR